MIKKGVIGLDDYLKFGGMLDSLEQAGAHLFIYSPKKGTVTAACKRDKLDDIVKIAGDRVRKWKVRGGVVYVTIRL